MDNAVSYEYNFISSSTFNVRRANFARQSSRALGVAELRSFAAVPALSGTHWPSLRVRLSPAVLARHRRAPSAKCPSLPLLLGGPHSPGCLARVLFASTLKRSPQPTLCSVHCARCGRRRQSLRSRDGALTSGCCTASSWPCCLCTAAAAATTAPVAAPAEAVPGMAAVVTVV